MGQVAQVHTTEPESYLSLHLQQCNVRGNEEADLAAKVATQFVTVTLKITMSLSQAKKKARKKSRRTVPSSPLSPNPRVLLGPVV